MPVAILFRTHIINWHILAEYERLKKRASGIGDVWFLYHSEDGTPPPVTVGNYFTFSTAEVQGANFPFRDFWSEGHYPLLLFARTHPDYDYYWMIEYDVRYTGQWDRFFDLFQSCASDLLASYVLKVEQDPRWPFWGDINFECDEQYLRRTFFPVIRLSKAAISTLDESHRGGAGGHCEAVTPCILLRSGLTVTDLNDAAAGAGPVYAPETFAPEYRKVPFLRTGDNLLYHPAYGLLTRRGLAHLIHRVRLHLNLLRLKKRLRRFTGRSARLLNQLLHIKKSSSGAPGKLVSKEE